MDCSNEKKENVTKRKYHICAKFTFANKLFCVIFYLHKIVLVLKKLFQVICKIITKK